MTREEARKKAIELVSQMTVEEKASQLKYDSPAIERLDIPEYNWWNECLHGVARAGTATVFPQAIGLAAMFDDELLKGLCVTDVECRKGRYDAFVYLDKMMFDEREQSYILKHLKQVEQVVKVV